jgi:hypothetical protein
MATTQSAKLWLVANPASGSNDDTAIQEILACCAELDIALERVIRFPDEELPTPADLDQAGVAHIAIFTGDGTVNALVTGLYGWDGAVLVLPGGTMNLLYHRLHGERETEEVLAAFARGETHRRRPPILRSAQGDGLSGVMAGPGTEWNDVREAIRNTDIGAMAAGTAQAIGQSIAGPMVRCTDPALGRDEGYPLLMLTPGEQSFAVDAYYADSIEDYLSQGLALLKRDFREGPHDLLGEVRAVTIGSVADEPVGLLIDGEPAHGGPLVRFTLVPCEVDLLATQE